MNWDATRGQTQRRAQGLIDGSRTSCCARLLLYKLFSLQMHQPRQESPAVNIAFGPKLLLIDQIRYERHFPVERIIESILNR